MKLSISRVLALIAIPCFLHLSYIAGSWCLADIYANPSITILKKWQTKNKILSDDNWDKLRADLSFALVLDSNNPDIHEYLALAIEGRFVDAIPKDKEAMPSRREAYTHYKQSISLRPTWPFPWIKLAMVKYRLGETDDEFYHAMHKADELAPWEPGVQRVIIDIGLHYWNSLSRNERDFVLGIIDKSLNHVKRMHSYKVLNLTKRYNKLELICLIHENVDYVAQYCKKNLSQNRTIN